jgi:hypothetical protein
MNAINFMKCKKCGAMNKHAAGKQGTRAKFWWVYFLGSNHLEDKKESGCLILK